MIGIAGLQPRVVDWEIILAAESPHEEVRDQGAILELADRRVLDSAAFFFADDLTGRRVPRLSAILASNDDSLGSHVKVSADASARRFAKRAHHLAVLQYLDDGVERTNPCFCK